MAPIFSKVILLKFASIRREYNLILLLSITINYGDADRLRTSNSP